MKWQDLAGWYGAAALLVAYAGVSFGYLAAGGAPFQLLNATGALGIVIVSVSKQNYPPAALNAVWLIVAAVALARILL